ncbi:MAG: hypothetical protein IVW56_03765 [Candidatus Binataceae bacterium]|nr:hypothetical protein [Candidatus Binataceae bacterium]
MRITRTPTIATTLTIIATTTLATTLTIAGGCAGILITMAPAMAQSTAPVVTLTSPGAPNTDLPIADLRAFDEFSLEHPDVIAQLCRHPRLIEDDSFLTRHPELRDFLASHPGLCAALEKDPGNFLPLNGGGAKVAGDAN